MVTEVKREDTFDQIAPISEAFPDGSFVEGVTVTAQIRTKKYNKFISALQCSWIDPETTRYLRLLCLDTTTWPLGDAAVDIQFVRDADGYTFSSETLPFTIIKDITSESL
jgi:hypothetical protein